jgi:HAD superfamily hydrolase (TIGR01549 family)
MQDPALIFLDFDGVVLESVETKIEAFAELFSSEPDRLPEIMDLHVRLGGISRYVKFDMIYRDILKRPLPADERERLGRRFEAIALERVLSCPLVAGAREFLDANVGHRPMVVVSGTPEPELVMIAKRRELDRYFTEMHGSPKTKPATMADVMARYGVPPDRAVMVGDAITDYEAAAEVGVPFIGRQLQTLTHTFPAGTPTVANLHGLSMAIARLFGEPA